MTQADVLEYIQEKREVTTDDIKTDLNQSRGSAYRKLRALSRVGWVDIDKASDGHSNIYRITERGLQKNPESIRPMTV